MSSRVCDAACRLSGQGLAASACVSVTQNQQRRDRAGLDAGATSERCCPATQGAMAEKACSASSARTRDSNLRALASRADDLRVLGLIGLALRPRHFLKHPERNCSPLRCMLATVGSVCVRRPGNGALRISTADKCHDRKFCRASHREVLPPRYLSRTLARVRDVANEARHARRLYQAQRVLSHPGNRLKVRGDRMELHHDQFRVSFRWTNQGPTEVEIVGR